MQLTLGTHPCPNKNMSKSDPRHLLEDSLTNNVWLIIIPSHLPYYKTKQCPGTPAVSENHSKEQTFIYKPLRFGWPSITIR